LADGRAFKAYLSGGLVAVDALSHQDLERARVNRELQIRISSEPVFRCPWRTEQERATFLAEQARADIAGEELAARLDAKLEASA
jgi:hypothetical protein